MRRQGNEPESEIPRKNRVISSKLQWGDTPVTKVFYVPDADYKVCIGNDHHILVKRQTVARYVGKFAAELEKIEREPCGTSGKVRTEGSCGRCDFIHLCRSVRPQRIALPPGMLLDRVTQFLLTRDAHRRFVQPVIADMRVE